MQIYVVRRGDTLWNISRRYGTTTQTLAYLNQLADPSKLVPGMSLIIPSPSALQNSLEVNGYAYPGISAEALGESMPYLSFLSPFSARAEADGTLLLPSDDALISAAAAGAAAVLLTVTNLSPDGSFSGAVAHSLLTNQAAQDALFDKLIAALKAKGYYGVSFDFEYIFPYDRDSYSQFICRAAELLHPLGFFVFCAVAPKESDEQQGLLYYAHDYAQLGRCADRVIVMTYEWGYLYSRPQAVSPVDGMRRVLDYAVARIVPGKLLMGFSNYGYDWALPWRQGQAAKLISNAAALNLAAVSGAQIEYDELAQAPHFTYVNAAGERREVWFEDARSILARLALVQEYSLAGISIWNLNFLNRSLLETLNDSASVEKVL